LHEPELLCVLFIFLFIVVGADENELPVLALVKIVSLKHLTLLLIKKYSS
jgi:hypothetical protein